MTPQQIKEARQKLGISQVEMAELCGIDKGTWLKWEKGTRKPNAIGLQHIKVLMWLDKIGRLADWQLQNKIN
jgi:DNA-binding transcriptional regulator YiaG